MEDDDNFDQKDVVPPASDEEENKSRHSGSLHSRKCVYQVELIFISAFDPLILQKDSVMLKRIKKEKEKLMERRA